MALVLQVRHLELMPVAGYQVEVAGLDLIELFLVHCLQV
jgi:hypothetical protein